MSLRQNALALIVLTVLMAIIGDWSGDPDLARLWYFALAVLLLGLAYEGWVMLRTSLGVSLSSPKPRWILGRPATLHMTFTHRLMRALTIEVAAEPPPAVEIDGTVRTLVVPEGPGASLSLAATPRRLGNQNWPALRTRVAGPLGLAWWTRPLTAQFTLSVAPDLLHDDAERAGGGAATGTRARSLLGAGGEVLQLREYRPGDPQHVIDWKATARSNRLVSRDFSEDQHLEIVLAIDAGRASALRAGDLDRFGHYANIASRFAEHAIAHDDQIGLVIFADRPLASIAPGRGVGTVARIRALLSAAQPASAESNPLNAVLRIRTLVRHRSLVVMLTDLDDATVAGQLAAAARLLLPKHLPLIAGLASSEAQSLAHTRAGGWLGPYESLAAQEYVTRLARNAAALRALGAPTLLALPDQMERAVLAAYAEFRVRRRV
jgi:uncharacterized protein (DUF58 family)